MINAAFIQLTMSRAKGRRDARPFVFINLYLRSGAIYEIFFEIST